MTNLTAIAQPPTNLTILDDFTDGNFTANPEWTIIDSPWVVETFFDRVATNMDADVNLNSFSALSTSFNKVCDVWQIDFISSVCPADAAGRKMEYYFLMTNASNDPRLASGYKLSYHLQVLVGTTRRNILYLQAVNNGVAVNPAITSFDNGTNCGLGKVTVVWANGTWSLFVANTLRGTGTDNTYNPSESAYQSLSVIDSVANTNSDSYRFSNIKFREATISSIRGEGNAVSGFMLKAYPNPATDLLQINLNSKKMDRGEIRLLDIQGRMLYSKSISMNAGDNRYDIPLKEQGIRSGTYILKLQSGTKEEQLKVVVQ